MISNKIKEIIIKCFIIFALISLVAGIISGLVLSVKGYALAVLIGLIIGLGIPGVLLISIFILSSTLKKKEPNQKDYKIKYYNCALDSDIESRIKFVYGEVTYSKNDPKNYYISYHKAREVVIVAVMHVNEYFCEEEYMGFMNEIPEIFERILNHTLIVIFIEEKKSGYLRDIMYAPEYNSLWDTKVFSVYDENSKRLKVNKTNSGTGNTAYNDALKDLNKIFTFVKK